MTKWGTRPCSVESVVVVWVVVMPEYLVPKGRSAHLDGVPLLLLQDHEHISYTHAHANANLSASAQTRRHLLFRFVAL